MSKDQRIIYRNNKSLFDLSRDVDESLLKLMEAINKRRLKLFELAAHQRIFLFILTRSFKTYSSIRILCAEGYGQDAANLLRSLLENLVTVQYFLYDKKQADELARRFVAYKWIILRRHLQEEEQQLDLLGKEKREDFLSRKELIFQKVEEFKKTFKVVSDRSLITWSGRTVRDMAKAVSKELLDEYEKTFRMCSRFSHPGILGDHEYMVQDGKSLIFAPTPSQIGININLRNAVKYAIDFFNLGNSLFGFDDAFKVDKLKNEFQKLLDNNPITLRPASLTSQTANLQSIRKSIVLFKI